MRNGQLYTMMGGRGNMRAGRGRDLGCHMGSSMARISSVDPRRLTNREAGIHALVVLGSVYPGIKFRDIPNIVRSRGGNVMGKKCSGWWDCTTSFVGSVKEDIGGTFADVLRFAGDKAGSAIRLFTDKDVVAGASDLGALYATGGGSGAFKDALEGIFGKKGANNIDGFLDTLGSLWKKVSGQGGDTPDKAGMSAVAPLAWVAAGTVLVFAFVTRPTGRRR